MILIRQRIFLVFVIFKGQLIFFKKKILGVKIVYSYSIQMEIRSFWEIIKEYKFLSLFVREFEQICCFSIVLLYGYGDRSRELKNVYFFEVRILKILLMKRIFRELRIFVLVLLVYIFFKRRKKSMEKVYVIKGIIFKFIVYNYLNVCD